MSSTVPPAASILVRAPAETLWARTVRARSTSPFPSTFTRPRPWAGVINFCSTNCSGDTRVAASNRARSVRSMIAYTLRKGVLLLPRPRTNGKRFTRRVCPPSNALWILPPVRAFWPFVPRPAVLPRPEPCPRPTRLSTLCEPGAGRKSDSFTDSLLYLHQVNHLPDHTTYRRGILMFNRLLQLAKPKCLDCRFLILGIAN